MNKLTEFYNYSKYHDEEEIDTYHYVYDESIQKYKAYDKLYCEDIFVDENKLNFIYGNGFFDRLEREVIIKITKHKIDVVSINTIGNIEEVIGIIGIK